MADTKISADSTKTTPVAADIVPILDSAASNANKKATLGSTQAAIIGQLLTIAPANPGGSTHTNYQLKVAAGPVSGDAYAGDEFIGLGYNIAGVTTTEPTSSLNQEIDWRATARGAAYTRTMEAYFQFAGASPADNAVRPFFFSFEPGDTSRGGSHKGELLYSYLSTGFNRAGCDGGGGLTIATSLAENVGGGSSNTGIAFFDIDGCRMEFLRSGPDIQRLTSTVTTGAAMQITVASGHNIQVGARIAIWKPDGLGSYTKAWNSSAVVFGTVTARTTTVLTTDITNNIGIVSGAAGTGYGWSMAWSDVAYYTPAFLQLSVGTGLPNASIPYQFEVAGISGFKGTVGIIEPAYAAANPTTAGGDLGASLLYMLSKGTQSAGGRRQIISSYNGVVGWSLGYADDTINNLDDYIFAIGAVQGTDSNFTVAKSSLCSINDGTNGYIGIGGVSGNFGATKLAIGAGTSTVAQIQLVAGTAKTTPLAGEMCYDGTNFKICKVAGTWANVTAV